MAIDPDVQVIIDALEARVVVLENRTESNIVVVVDGDRLVKQDGTEILLEGGFIVNGVTQ